MPHARLQILDAEVDVRAAEVKKRAPDWPCKSGCAECCRSLGAPMLLSAPEWARLEAGLAALPEAERLEIEAGFDAMAPAALAGAPVLCPVLEDETSRCRLYAHRPLSCRTHGYYASRDGGYWCDAIEERVEAGGAEGVVFGRHEVITRTAERTLGEPLSWAAWRARRPR